ncbi:TPA: dATP/dGTP pyrophosphohydrolase domain-containing protein [Salmonella enterica subsp. enterica serovar Saintpaul]
MTTITKEFTKEQLIAKAQEQIAFCRDTKITGEGRTHVNQCSALFEIALASLTAEPVAWTDAEELRDLRTVGFCEMFTVEPVSKDADMYRVIPLYTDSPVPERERIRREHAEWSDATFGDVGPIGPLKHLSKEALEAAAEPDDLSEWADMQFLLWDAQRRAGITDEQITQAMVDKLKVNKQREWPEPKDGEPRLHIKEQPAPVIPDGWISCSERMPEDEQEVIVHNKLGYRYVSYFDEHSGLFFDMRGGNQMNCIEHILVTHWMPLPAAPEPEQS